MQVGDLKKTNTDGKKLEEAFYAVDNHTSLSSVVEGSDWFGCRIPEIETIADIEWYMGNLRQRKNWRSSH
jgi:hypothetical protein